MELTQLGDKTMQLSSKTIQEACESLQSNLEYGLSSAAVCERQREFGKNVLEMQGGESIIDIFLEQIKDPMILLLLGSALLSLIVGEINDAISITVTISIVITVAIYQGYQSIQSLQALQQLAPPYCHVLRDGGSLQILASELVPGDIIKFSRGDRIPADARLVTSVSLDIDESNLTGESEPRRKLCEAINSFSSGQSFTEKNNIVFMGTLVTNGHGQAIVFGTGKRTELGLVLGLISNVFIINID
jgi:P-type Ca2+ transporter type 2C